MTPDLISKHVVVDRLDWISRMVEVIHALPLNDPEYFFADERNLMTAESGLRRALEALFDLGRHILAKGFGEGVSEYREIAVKLKEHKILTQKDAELLISLAGYRNRLVHFYHEVGAEELFDICSTGLVDLERITQAYRLWLKANPERMDDGL
jgi:uncharacterized protein YutE (UPF0331/DUF86 family)